ncbi:unnamed protein product [Owenia fusiformis]|uniref:Uncharacterized protein n=1 Tax=Owenia fusiformis TaxID=6347 RepID=A0A8J1TR81_OWEFU|nr:unnamed protein product [Owenia fusiformis]
MAEGYTAAIRGTQILKFDFDAADDLEIPQYTFDDITVPGELMNTTGIDNLEEICGQDSISSMNPDIFLNSSNNSSLIGKTSPSRSVESGIESMCSPHSVIELDSDFDVENVFSPTSIDMDNNDETSLDLLTYLANETGLSVVESDPKPEPQSERKMALRQHKNIGKTVSSGGKIKPFVMQTVKIKPCTNTQAQHSNTKAPQKCIQAKRSPTFTCEEDDEIYPDPSRKNAIQAKINREKKKLYVATLENDVTNLKKENETLKVKSVKMEKQMKIMQDEVTYLRNVLANQSTLSALLKNIPNASDVSLTSSFKRRYDVENDHGYQKPKHARHSDGGVCLHVENNKVSLEFCSKCAKLANNEDIIEIS